VSKKSAKIAGLIESFHGHELNPHYLGYFECFNQGLFYEAHDVLEELWLIDRHGSNGAFYKGLIQLAGAFVHLQKHTELRPRLRPAAALLKLARTNLSSYPSQHHRLNVEGVLALIEDWLLRLEAGEFSVNPLTSQNAPRLRLGPLVV
jgi:predicted metal-dependent hydrolase